MKVPIYTLTKYPLPCLVFHRHDSPAPWDDFGGVIRTDPGPFAFIEVPDGSRLESVPLEDEITHRPTEEMRLVIPGEELEPLEADEALVRFDPERFRDWQGVARWVKSILESTDG